MTRKPEPREMPSMTDAQRRDNWWRYHWLYVLVGVLAATAAAGVAWERLTRERYDCSVALVTKYAAAPAEIASMQTALEAVCPDLDGDGEVHVAVNAIQIDYTSTRMDDAAIQVMTTNVDKLNSDFYTRQSGIFLLDDPENFQKAHGALAYLDGSAPPEGAEDWEKMTVPWEEWAGSADVELHNCDGKQLWFARRAAFSEADEAAFAGAGMLWEALWGA